MKLCTSWSILSLVSLAVVVPAARAATDLLALDASEISKALVGKLIRYDPPGSADMGVHEEFHRNGSWRGILYGRGSMPFTGTWAIKGKRICVTADKGSIAQRWHSGEYCRKVWRAVKTGDLQIDYLPGQRSSSRKMGLQTVSARDIRPIR